MDLDLHYSAWVTSTSDAKRLASRLVDRGLRFSVSQILQTQFGVAMLFEFPQGVSSKDVLKGIKYHHDGLNWWKPRGT